MFINSHLRNINAIFCFRFNLMAVVPDRRIAITHKLKMLKTNKAIVTAALEKLLSTKHSPPNKSTVGDAEQKIKTEDSNENQALKKETAEDTASKDIKSENDKTEVSDKKDNSMSNVNLLQRLSLQNQNDEKPVVI